MSSTKHGQDHRLFPAEADGPHRPMFDPALTMRIHAENPDIEPAAVALYEKYLNFPASLCGPTDHATLEHYTQLYIMSLRTRDEVLHNAVMDLVRHFYRCEKLSASPLRLDYLYRASTTTPSVNNMMKRFLVSTAAFRALVEGTSEGKDEWGREMYVSGQMMALLQRDHAVMNDFLGALIDLHRSDLPDARLGTMCSWHVHEKTRKCAKEYSEAWEGD